MKIFISGGYGLLGARAAYYFSNLGYKITVGTSSESKFLNYKFNSKIQTRLIKWSDRTSISEAIRGNEIIFHFAGMNAKECSKDPVYANEFNGYKTKLFLEIAEKQNISEFIFLSTAHVYNKDLNGFFDENSKTDNNHPYAVSNLIGEKFVEEFHNSNRINGKILRLSNIFGKPDIQNINCWDLYINNICKQIYTNRNIKVFSNPNIYRNFLSITDFNDILNQIINKKIVLKNSIILNVGNTKSIQLGKMAELVAERYYDFKKNKVKIIYECSNSNENFESLDFSINKLKKLGIQVKNSLNDELIALFNYCDYNFK